PLPQFWRPCLLFAYLLQRRPLLHRRLSRLQLARPHVLRLPSRFLVSPRILWLGLASLGHPPRLGPGAIGLGRSAVVWLLRWLVCTVSLLCRPRVLAHRLSDCSRIAVGLCRPSSGRGRRSSQLRRRRWISSTCCGFDRGFDHDRNYSRGQTGNRRRSERAVGRAASAGATG